MSVLANRSPLSDTSARASASTPAATPRSTSIFAAPQWVQALYSRFPLVVLDAEDERTPVEGAGELWVSPPSTIPHEHQRAWASASPTCLRVQLLFLLRHVPVTFRPWPNASAAPGGTLPALHTPDALLPASDIRPWLDTKYPLKGKNKDLQGMPDQQAYDHGVALAQLVLGHLLPAYTPFTSHLAFPTPPPLAAGLTAPLPAALTGDAREVDTREVLARAKDALDAVNAAISGGDWALGAKHPTPLDALIASQVYPLYAAAITGTAGSTSASSPSSALSAHLASLPDLGAYVDRVLAVAGAHVR